MIDTIIAVARRFDFVRETQGQNRGVWVEFIQRFTGNEPGDSWCASFLSLVLYIAYRGKPPFLKSAVVQDFYRACLRAGYIVATAEPGDLFFYVNGDNHAHHVGIVTRREDDGTVFGIAGNTSVNGKSSNGDGVYEHEILLASKFARFAYAH